MDLRNKITLYLALASCVVAAISPIAFCHDSPEKTKFGGKRNVTGGRNTGEIESIAQFAVQQYNNRQNALLKFVKVVKASEQVVAGKMYYLTLEAVDGEEKKTYEATVWVKPWENFKELQDFKEYQDITSFISSNLGVGHGRG